MLIAGMVMLLSTGLFVVYMQSLCQRILRREFDQPYYQVILDAARLEFADLSKALEEGRSTADYPRLRQGLRCDFLALTYLLKRLKGMEVQDHLLSSYARVLFLSLGIRHLLRLRLEPAVAGLTAISQYFANVLGEQMHNLSLASEPFYVLSLD